MISRLFTLLTLLTATFWAMPNAYALQFTLDTRAWNGTAAIFEIDLVDGAPTRSQIKFSPPTVDGVAMGTGGTLDDRYFFNYAEFPIVLGDELSASISVASGVAPPSGFFPDSISLFLLGANSYHPLFSTRDPTGADSLLLWDIGFPEPTVYAGTVYNRDTVSVPTPGTALLLGLGLVVLVRKNVARFTAVGGAALFLILPAHAATPAIGDATDYTAQVAMVPSGLVLNRRTRTFDSTVTIKNTSSEAIPAPLALAVHDLPSGVVLVNATAISQEGIPFITVEEETNFRPDQEQKYVLKFVNGTNLRFPISIRLVRFSQPVPAAELIKGPDANSNGVRDDLEPVLDMRYEGKPELKAAASQLLRGMRGGLVETGSINSAFDAMLKVHKAYDCMEQLFGTEQSETEVFYLRDLMLDTKERINSWLELGNMLTGQSIPIGSVNACE